MKKSSHGIHNPRDDILSIVITNQNTLLANENGGQSQTIEMQVSSTLKEKGFIIHQKFCERMKIHDSS